MDAIASFWSWWSTARPHVERAIAASSYHAVADEIAERVSSIHPALDWELGPGVRGALHALCVSGKGDPELRRITERWRRAGPDPDHTWEYHPAREGSPDNLSLELELEGHRVAFQDFVVAIEIDGLRERIDVVLFHPVFPRMTKELRSRVAFLLLDNTLGEDGVERWIGAIETVTRKPARSGPVRALFAAVDELSGHASGERWALLRVVDEGAPVYVTVNRAVKRVDHLRCDLHCAIDLAIVAPDVDDLPDRAELARLDALEGELVAALGDGVVHVARETGRARRRIHLFAPELGRAGHEIEAWAASHRRERAIDIAWRRDPRWSALERFR